MEKKTITPMEQIELISVEARKLGMKYGEYVAKFGHTLPKPKPTPRREIEIYAGIEHKKRLAHVEYDLICQNEACGKTFKARKKNTKLCPDCRAENKRDYKRQYNKDRREGKR